VYNINILLATPMAARCGGMLMRRLPARTRIFNATFTLAASFALLHSLTCRAYAQYSDKLDEICNPCSLDPFFHTPAPIGDVGKIETVVDLRGFIPMSLPQYPSSNVASRIFYGPEYPRHWFKIPTKKALLMLYYGNLPFSKFAEDTVSLEKEQLSQTTFIRESDAKGANASWCELAYTLAKDSAPLFERIVGGSGFQATEPITVFFTEQSTFVILSFKYTSYSALVANNGQALIGLEFSRSSRRYKTFYQLYSTVLINKPTADVAMAIAPYVAKAVANSF
jgi:hypothetical protein